MKKLICLLFSVLAAVSYSTVSHADGRGWRHGHGRGHHHGHHHHHYYRGPEVRYYAPPPIVHYYPAPPVAYYSAPPVPYYPQPPAYSYHYDRRSSQGLVGGMLGSAFGYEAGNGDPIAAGIGAAAGSYLGNGIARPY